MKHSFTLLLSLFLSFSATGQELLEKTITVDGLDREYLLYVPAAYDGSENWPLVFNLHGGYWDPQSHIDISGMNAVADTAHFLLVYPKGETVNIGAIPGNPPGVPPTGTGWNLGGGMSDNDEIAFIDGIIEELLAEYLIDEARIYSTGFSLGGIMSTILACELPGRFAAIASVGGSKIDEGSDFGLGCEVDQPVPAFHIHGTNDFIDPYDGRTIFLGAEASVDFWLNLNNCEAQAVEAALPDVDTLDQSTVTSFKYPQCEGGAEVWLYRLNGGGHWWPGGSPIPPGFEVLAPVNRDINASVEVWNFFNRHSLQPVTAIEGLSSADINLRSYPNPVYRQLTLEFDLSQAAVVQLTLFNSLGQPVCGLSKRRLLPGGQQLRIETQGLAAGIYFYRLQTGAQQISRPVILKNGL